MAKLSKFKIFLTSYVRLFSWLISLVSGQDDDDEEVSEKKKSTLDLKH